VLDTHSVRTILSYCVSVRLIVGEAKIKGPGELV
jgi:hypothetical protein